MISIGGSWGEFKVNVRRAEITRRALSLTEMQESGINYLHQGVAEHNNIISESRNIGCPMWETARDPEE
jgi:hypothetical protein